MLEPRKVDHAPCIFVSCSEFPLTQRLVQNTLKNFHFRLHEDMPLEEKFHFFSLVSPTCESMMKEVRNAQQNLKEKYESGLQMAMTDVEKRNMDLHEDVVCVLLAEISEKLGAYRPGLGNLLRANLEGSNIEARQEVRMGYDIKAYHRFSLVLTREHFYRNISLEERLLLCVVIFVQMKADKVSKERVWGLLTWDQRRIEADFDNTGYYFPWCRPRILKEEVRKRVTAALHSGCCKGLDEEDEVVGVLLTELNKALHKLVKERTPYILRVSGFALAHQQQKRRALLKETQGGEGCELERDWI